MSHPDPDAQARDAAYERAVNASLHAEIDSRFGFHPNVTRADGERHEYVRAIVRTVVHELVDYVPEGRERALMITAFDEGLMWANAAVARARPLEET